MSCQLVDINADGYKDILAGSFSGTPQIIMGGEKGFAEPVAIKDKNDEDVLIAAFWNTEDKKWDESDRSGSEGHCTSSSLVDWDNDGDLDLLLGDYYGGRLYIQLNEGSKTEPKFAGKNEAVMADEKPVVIKSGLAAPRVVDWNGDGKFDLLLGGSKGGVYYFANTGTADKPEFAASETLIEPVKGAAQAFIGRVPANEEGRPTLPGSSYHIEPCDYDGDGDLDLLVGARSSWIVKLDKEPTKEEQAEIDELTESVQEMMKEIREMMTDVDDEERKELVKSKEYRELLTNYSAAQRKLSKLKPDPNRSGDFVWLFRRK